MLEEACFHLMDVSGIPCQQLGAGLFVPVEAFTQLILYVLLPAGPKAQRGDAVIHTGIGSHNVFPGI